MVQKMLPLLLFAGAGVAVAQAPVGVPAAPGAVPSATAPGSTPGTNRAMPATAGPTVSAGSSASRFKLMDKNNDGYLSAEEMNSISSSGANVNSAGRFTVMDTNHDGKISAAEFSATQTGASRVPAKDITSDPTGQAHASSAPASTTPGKSSQP